MKHKDFFLSKAVYRRKRTWHVSFLDKEDSTVVKSIEEMLGYMRSLYQEDVNTDLAVAYVDGNKRLFIDGCGTCVTVSLCNNSRREFYLGYCISPMRYEALKRHTMPHTDSDEHLLECVEGKVIPLKDYFSHRRLGSEYNF